MCEIAPFQMHCEYEDHNCVQCAVEKVRFALVEAVGSIPVLGYFTQQYGCERFAPSTEERVVADAEQEEHIVVLPKGTPLDDVYVITFEYDPETNAGAIVPEPPKEET